jgi:DNA-binding response OmpR family regulator
MMTTQKPIVTTQKQTALIAEDDRALADIMRLALIKAGFDVTVAHHGNRALSLAKETSFDLIITDYQMPGLNGEQVLQEVRREGASKNAVMVLCSAKSYELDSERLRLDLDLAHVFYKPFSLAEIVSTSRSALATTCPSL